MGIYNIVDDEPAPVIEWAASAGDHDRREAPAPTCQHGRATSLPVESTWTPMVKPRCPQVRRLEEPYTTQPACYWW
jgi:hypothetical protein